MIYNKNACNFGMNPLINAKQLEEIWLKRAPNPNNLKTQICDIFKAVKSLLKNPSIPNLFPPKSCLLTPPLPHLPSHLVNSPFLLASPQGLPGSGLSPSTYLSFSLVFLPSLPSLLPPSQPPAPLTVSCPQPPSTYYSLLHTSQRPAPFTASCFSLNLALLHCVVFN